MVRLPLLSLALLLTLAAPAAAIVSLPGTPVAGNPADRLLALPIEDSTYDPATRCSKRVKPGVVALQQWLEAWDCGYWAAGMAEFSRYDPCFDKRGKRRKRVNPTVAHRDHVHLGMTKAGARGQTSFWSAGR